MSFSGIDFYVRCAAMQKLDYLSLAGYKHEVIVVSQQTAKRLVSLGFPI
jgi:hypothetical protein